MFGFIGNVGVVGWVVIGIAVLLLVGTRGQIPQLMRDLGRGINSFRTGLKEGTDDADAAAEAVEAQEAETVEVEAKAKPKAKASKAKAKKASS